MSTAYVARNGFPFSTLSFIPSSGFLCLLVLVSVWLLSRPPPPPSSILRNHQGKKEKKKKKKKQRGWKGQSTGWPLIHDSALKFSAFKSNCPASRSKRCHSPAPGHSMSPASFEGLTRIFLSCQGRVMGAKENRGEQRSPHSQISPGCAALNWVIKEAAKAGTSEATNPNTSLTFQSLLL